MIAVVTLLVGLAHASIELETPPARGERTVVVLQELDGRPRGGQTVRVVHRPGLAGEREVAIGITDGLGRVRWTPEIAGVAEVRAGDETLRLHVAWPGTPIDTAVVLVLLAVAGLGAATWGAVGRNPRRR